MEIWLEILGMSPELDNLMSYVDTIVELSCVPPKEMSKTWLLTSVNVTYLEIGYLRVC